MADGTTIVSGTLITTDPAAKQILLHLNEERFAAMKEYNDFARRSASLGTTNRSLQPKEQFVVADLDETHLVIKTHLVEEVKREFQAELEAFTYKAPAEESIGPMKK